MASRQAIWLASAAAILPSAVAASPPIPAPVQPIGRFQPPSGPMVLTRTLRRPLPGGAEILTRRSYEIRFVREGGGYRIDGTLVDVSVEAPASLQAIARLEKARPDTGMFPMRVDAWGRLVSGGGPDRSEQIRLGLGEGRAAVERMALSGPETDRAKAFVGQFAGRPGLTAWPEDLFSPVPGERRQSSSIALPDGGSGEVRIDIVAHTAGGTGLLETFARTVTTMLESTSRITQEVWTLRGKG